MDFYIANFTINQYLKKQAIRMEGDLEKKEIEYQLAILNHNENDKT